MTLSDELEKDKQLLKDMRNESGLLYDALTSIGTEIAAAIEEAVEGAEGLNDIGKTIANTYGKEITNSLKKQAKSLEGNIGLQIKINKGQNASKEIEKAIDANLARKQVTLMHINNLRSNTGKLTKAQLKINEKLTAEAIKTYEAQKEILEQAKVDNKEKQKSKSLTELMSESLVGMADKLDKTGTLSEILKGNLTGVATVARLGEAAAVSLWLSVWKGMVEVNKQTVGLQKNMGLSSGEAAKFRKEMAGAALATGTTKVNTRDTLKTVATLNDQFGTAATTIGKDIVGEMALLGKYSELSAESQGSFAAYAMKSGIHASEVTRQARQQVVASENEYGVRLNINQTLDEAGKITGMIRANLGFNIVAISGAIAKAKQFGMTLQDLASISGNLLNFQSSIEAELTAELFTGKQLNLEKARLYALTGDYKNLTEEIKKNAGGELEFARMNVLQKEKLAAALGMSADQMSNMVYDQSNLAKLAQEARDIGDDDLADSLTKRDIQQQFNDLIVKAQTIMVDMAAGPLGHLVEGMGNLLEKTALLKGLLLVIGAVKMVGLISSMISLGAAIGLTGAMSAWTIGVLTFGVGLAIAVPIILGAIASMKSSSQDAAKSAKVGNFADLPKGKIHNVDEGEAKIHKGEFVGHQSDIPDMFKASLNPLIQLNSNKPVESSNNFSKVNDTLAMIHQAIMGQKTTVTAEGWHGTRYR